MGAILISGISMSFFIVLLLLTKKDKSLTDRILAVWVGVIGIHLLGYYLNQMGYWETCPHLIGITAPFPLLHGPLLFLYTLYSLRSDTKIRKIDYLHFLPALLAYLYMSRFFFFYTAEEKILVDQGRIPDFQVFEGLLLLASLGSGLAYSFLSYRLTWKHKRKIDNNFSFDEGINLRWLRWCILGIGGMFVTAAIVVGMREGFGIVFPFNGDYLFYSFIIALIFYIGFFGIKHRNIFTNNPQIVGPHPGQAAPAEKYRNSGLREEEARAIHRQLLELMEKEKPYLDPRLTLAALAGSLGVSTNQLSQVINQEEAVHFHDFINRYRVEEFIRRASRNKHFSLLALALDAGFNSKSSFNSIFKKFKGLTPSRYLTEGVRDQRKG